VNTIFYILVSCQYCIGDFKELESKKYLIFLVSTNKIRLTELQKHVTTIPKPGTRALNYPALDTHSHALRAHR
jgi:hypothetical protein